MSLPLPGVNLDWLRDLRPECLSEEVQEAVIALAVQILECAHRPGEVLTDPEKTKAFLRLRLSAKEIEVFGCIFLDNRHRVIAVEELFFGTVDGASVHPRVVVQKALTFNAVAIVAYHNHPSGLPEPSQADQRITSRIRDALGLVDIRLLDHIVVGEEGTVSFAERGLV